MPEQYWNQIEPLVLFIQDGEAPASRIVSSRVPGGFESLSFNNLKLKLGPSLRLVSQPLASFETNGSPYLKWLF